MKQPTPPIIQAILDRHASTLKGKLEYHTLQSRFLGLNKGFFVYLPPQFSKKNKVNLLFAFRGHEREWLNCDEDKSRTKTLAEQVDAQILDGKLKPTVMVFPGLNSDDNTLASLGIDMAGKWPKTVLGLGKGAFYQFLTKELLPVVEAMASIEKRIFAGFSLGGFTCTVLSVLQPGYPDHVIMYDGLYMWHDMHDPRKLDPGLNDSVWLKHPIFDAALGKPRVSSAMRKWNTSDALVTLTQEQRERLKKTTFWIATAAFDGDRGNKERGEFYTELLQKNGIPLGWETIVADPHAEHSWFWADKVVLSALHSIG